MRYYTHVVLGNRACKKKRWRSIRNLYIARIERARRELQNDHRIYVEIRFLYEVMIDSGQQHDSAAVIFTLNPVAFRHLISDPLFLVLAEHNIRLLLSSRSTWKLVVRSTWQKLIITLKNSIEN